MNAGLRYLLVSRPRGGLRGIRRKYGGRNGRILMAGLVLLGVAIWLLQSNGEALATRSQLDSLRPGADGIRTWGPAVSLLVALVGIRPGAFYFKAAEVQFLFPAPISRTSLLVYNILARLQIVLLSTLWVGLFTIRFAGTWLGGFLAIFGLLAFNQLAAQLGGVWLAGLDPSPRARRRRRVVLGALAAGLAAAALASWPEARSDWPRLAESLVRHPVVSAVTWLTRPFIELFLATRPVDLLPYGCAAAAILGLQVFAQLRIDQRTLERLAGHGRTTGGHSKKVRLTRDGEPGALAKARAGLRIPARVFPQLAGVGPLAWRQAQELVRTPGKLLRGGLGLFAVLPVLILRLASADQDPVALAAGSLTTALLMIPMMFDGADFRRDLDRLPLLRSLPVRPAALVMGQLVSTSLVISFWMVVGALAIVAILGIWSSTLLYLLALTIPPFAVMTAAIDNWIFLLMPYRIRPDDPGEATFVGRITVVMTVKAIVIVTAFGASIGVAFACFRWLAPSVVFAGIVAAGMLLLCCVPLILGLTRTFQRFDVARYAAE